MKRSFLASAVVTFFAICPLHASTIRAILTPGTTVSSLPDFEDFGDDLDTLNTTFGTGFSSPSGPFRRTS